jgi:hypothetical protein
MAGVLFLQICGHLLDFGQIPLRWLFPKPKKQDPLPFLNRKPGPIAAQFAHQTQINCGGGDQGTG